jgi:hypothetical protein
MYLHSVERIEAPGASPAFRFILAELNLELGDRSAAKHLVFHLAHRFPE